MILEVKNISKSFGKLKVLDDVSFTVAQGEYLALIGKNEWEKTKEFQIESWSQMKRQLVSSKNKLSGFFSDLNLN